MLQIKLEPQQIQLAIMAIHQVQFQGKAAHLVSATLKKFEDNTKLEDLIETMFVWAMKQPNRKVKDMEYEITEGIYDYWKK